MSYQNLEYVEEGTVGILTLSRPKALNALNAELLDELGSVLDKVAVSQNLRVLIVTGAGEKAFVAGADIKEMANHSSDRAFAMAQKGQGIFQQLEDLKIPVIAAVNGFALGGGMELAMSCDFVIASERAKFGLPETSLGLIPGYGGTQRLWRHVGLANAKMITFTGDMFSASQMQTFGLVSETVVPEELMDRVLKIAKTIASRGPVAVSECKTVITRAQEVQQQEGLEMEAKAFANIFSTEDHNEGIAAFIEKRLPKFKGK